MNEYRHDPVVPSLLAERLTELTARGWTVNGYSPIGRDQSGNVDGYTIEATRSSLLYCEVLGAPPIHRDDLFYRLVALTPANRAGIVGALHAMEAQQFPAAPASDGEAIAQAVGGERIPTDAEAAAAAAAQPEPGPVDRSSLVVCARCDPMEEGAPPDQACRLCSGRGRISVRQWEAYRDHPELFDGAPAEPPASFSADAANEANRVAGEQAFDAGAQADADDLDEAAGRG